MLTKEECYEIHKKNCGKVAWLDFLASNDGRIVLKNSEETLHVFMSAEYDESEQSQAARLCAALNNQSSFFKPKN